MIGEACRVPEKSVLARTNRQLYELLTPVLYKYNVQREGGSAMFWAAQHGCIETLERIVSYGAEVNDNTASRFHVVHRSYYPYRIRRLHDTFFTPLHIAAKFGQDGAVKWLLNHGARIEAMAHNLCACQEGVVDIANDSDFDPRLSPLVTPFHIAICNGRLRTTKLLVSRGAETDGGVASPLHTAARFNNAGAISFLLEKCLVYIDEPDSQGYTPLHLACMEIEDVSALETLLEIGADVEAQADDGRTPLAFACERGYFKAALRLLAHGADPAVEWDGQTPIQAAALSMRHFFPHEAPPDPETWEDEREELIRRLLELGVDVNEVGGLGTTALHIAAGQQSLARTIQCLLDAGADVDAQDDLLQTPLHVAFESRDPASILIKIVPLLQRGGRLDATCTRGCSAFKCALGVARLRGDYSIINSIFQHVSTENFGPSFLSTVVKSSYSHSLWEECRVLIRHGALLDVSPDEMVLDLDDCITARDVSRMQFLLDTFPGLVTPRWGLNVAFRDYDLTIERELPMIRALLDRPDLDVRGHAGGIKNASPLLLACEKHHKPWIIQRLLDNSAEVNVFDEDFKTPLFWAVWHECFQSVRSLLRCGANPFLAPSEEDWLAYVRRYQNSWRQPSLSSSVADFETAFIMAIKIKSCDAFVVESCPHDPKEPHILRSILENHSVPPIPANPSSESYIDAALKYPESLDILLKKGADPNARGHSNLPPLVAAAKFIWDSTAVQVITTLLQLGADIYQKGDTGESFLDVFKTAIAQTSRIKKVADIQDPLRPEVASSLVRSFHIVIDASSGKERIEVRPQDEFRAARRE